MAIAAGRLRHWVTLQSRTLVQDPTTGEDVLTWVDQASVYAAVEPLSTREFIAAQATQSEVSVRIIIRHRADIDATWRVLYRDKAYNVQGVLADQESGLEYLTLPCAAGVNDGR